MSGLIAIAGRPAAAADAESIARAINPLELLDLESFSDNGMLMYVGQHAEAPCRQIAFAARPGFTCLLAGDVVNHAELDWSAIRRSLLAGDAYPDCLRKLRGAFGIVIADHDHNRLWAISDPFAFQSVMVRIGDDGAIVTTSLAAMLRAMPGTALVNDDWIHETIYFNHGTGATTPLVGVARLPAGTIWQVDLDTWAATQRAYRVRAARPSQLCAGPEAIDEALNIFRSTVPRSYPAGASVTIGLSEGLDCRAVLAMTPEHVLERLDSFTFGVERSTEIKEAAKIARKLGLAHTPVLLNDAFLEQLPGLAEETVFLSGGLQNVNRSHLLYTYRSLRSEGDPYSVIMTGVSGDHIFRDHIQGWGNVPHIMSGDAASLHRIGRTDIDATFYTRIFGNRFEEFRSRIDRVLDDLEQEYGEFQDPEAYLSYLMYEAGPRYFGGQAAIANTFSTFRTPYWDPDIIDLGFRLQDATLGLSVAASRKNAYRETKIQASIIASSKTVGQLSYKHLPISVFANGNQLVFQAHRLKRKIFSIVRQKSFVYSEDWSQWYRTVMRDQVSHLLGDDSRMREYVSGEFIDGAIADADVHWIGKLLTAEHTLRFIETGWSRKVN